MPKPSTEVEIFWKNLDNIRNIFIMSEEEFASYLDISLSVYRRKKASGYFLPFSNLHYLAKSLNLNVEELTSPEFNLTPLIEKSNANNALDERYTYAMFSSNIPILNILNYSEET